MAINRSEGMELLRGNNYNVNFQTWSFLIYEIHYPTNRQDEK